MSADNWTYCPHCKAALDQHHTLLQKTSDEAYGRINKMEWLALEQKAKFTDAASETLREDYHLGISINDGGGAKFEISYSALCGDCGFVFEYSHQEDIIV